MGDKDDQQDEGSKGCCGQGLLRVIMIICNVAFILFGAVLLVIGIFALIGTDRFSLSSGDALKNLPSIAEAAGLNDTREAPSKELKLDASVLSQDLAIAFIVIGALLVLLAIEGFLGVIKKEVCALVLYAVLVGIVLLLQIILVVGFFQGMLRGQIEARMLDTIKDDYRGLDDYESESVLWNFMMLKFECCGVKDFEDFNNAKKWDRVRQFMDEDERTVLLWPIACCKVDKDFESFESLDCVKSNSTSSSNIEEGCYDALADYLSKFKTTATIAIVIAFIFQAVLIVIASILAYLFRREKQQAEEGDNPKPKDKAKKNDAQGDKSNSKVGPVKAMDW